SVEDQLEPTDAPQDSTQSLPETPAVKQLAANHAKLKLRYHYVLVRFGIIYQAIHWNITGPRMYEAVPTKPNAILSFILKYAWFISLLGILCGIVAIVLILLDLFKKKDKDGPSVSSSTGK